MIRFWLAPIVFLITPVAGFARSPVFDCEGEGMLTVEESRGQLSKAQEVYARVGRFHARFTQDSYLAALDLSELSSGEVWYSRPGKMKWYYREPEEQVFWIKEETLWFYQLTDKQVLIDKLSKVLLSELPVSFLLGMGDLGRDFEVIQGCKNRDGIVVSLKPRPRKGAERDEGLEGFSLLLNESTHRPKGALVRDVGGNTTAIVLSDLEDGAKFAENLFDPSYPSGVDIQDRRTGEVRGLG